MSKVKSRRKNKSVKAVNIAVSCFLVLAVLLCVFVVIEVVTQGYVSAFGYSLFRVVTGSMEPQIPVGALLVCREVEIESLAVGDIVCFFSQEAGRLDQIITHRIIEISQNMGGAVQLQTKGDANWVADIHYVTTHNLIGQVIYHTGREGTGYMLANLLSFLTSGVGFITCLALPCMMIAGLMLQECVKSMQADLDAAMRLLNNEPEPAKKDAVVPQKAPAEEPFSSEDIEKMKAQIRKELMEELGLTQIKTQTVQGLSADEVERMSRSIRAELREELSRIANTTQ